MCMIDRAFLFEMSGVEVQVMPNILGTYVADKTNPSKWNFPAGLVC